MSTTPSPADDPHDVGPLFDAYARRLVRLAEQHLSRKLAARIDGEDIVQSVFRTFFRRDQAGEFRFEDASDTWRLLVRITLQKVRAKARFHARQKRAAAAEVEGDWLLETLNREPDPAEVALFTDLLEALIHDLPPLYVQVLERRLQGESPTDVARSLDISRNTVYRVLDLLQDRLRQIEDGPAS